MTASLLLWLTLLLPAPANAQDGPRAQGGAPAAGPNALALRVQAERGSYLPGEPVNFRFSVVNTAERSVALSPGSTVWTGRLRVFVAAAEGGEYRQYYGPRWGLDCAAYSRPVILDRENPSFETEASVLWNHALETSHLNERAAREYVKGRITSPYALPRPGRYRIKAVLADPEARRVIESEPVEIEVEEPAATDLLVWNALKADGRYAYLLQTGGLIATPRPDEAAKMIERLEQLLAAYPESRYAAHIAASLSKYRESAARLKAARGGQD